jgi:hypothetical protein
VTQFSRKNIFHIESDDFSRVCCVRERKLFSMREDWRVHQNREWKPVRKKCMNEMFILSLRRVIIIFIFSTSHVNRQTDSLRNEFVFLQDALRRFILVLIFFAFCFYRFWNNILSCSVVRSVKKKKTRYEDGIDWHQKLKSSNYLFMVYRSRSRIDSDVVGASSCALFAFMSKNRPFMPL